MQPTNNLGSKTPTTGISPVVSGPGLGVSPGHGYTYKMPFRKCRKTDGITYPIAICFVCKTVVKPNRKEYSKTGAHGTFYYVHKHQLSFVVLKQTNSGKRSVQFIGNIPEHLAYLVKEAWLEYETDVRFIEDIVNDYLYLSREGREENLVLSEVNGKVSLIEGGEW